MVLPATDKSLAPEVAAGVVNFAKSLVQSRGFNVTASRAFIQGSMMLRSQTCTWFSKQNRETFRHPDALLDSLFHHLASPAAVAAHAFLLVLVGREHHASTIIVNPTEGNGLRLRSH